MAVMSLVCHSHHVSSLSSVSHYQHGGCAGSQQTADMVAVWLALANRSFNMCLVCAACM